MTIEDCIKQHEELVMCPVSKRYAACCPHCEHDGKFHRHEIRRRTFYVESESGEAFAVQSWLVRWRCSNCGRRFTDYPPFALPHKRFVKPSVFGIAMKFFRDGRSTYRRATSVTAAHSSLWRWLSWLADLFESGRRCLQFLMASNPESILHRNGYLVAPWKWRSACRGSTLHTAFRTLAHIVMFEESCSPTLEHHSLNE